ncbi:MAG: cytochrome c oxidase subunit I [Microthrixaceae bacterium]
MTIVEPERTNLPETTGGGELVPASETSAESAPPLGVFTRPTSTTGWRSWLTTVDHKKIGIMYGVSAMVFFLVGGVEALMIRTQLAAPDQNLLSADLYNQVFTMHGVTMIFLFIMPLAAGFINYLLPLQIGARDVAFPRMNALSFWIFLFGALFVNSSWFLGGGADGGWFNYAPNSSVVFSPSHGIDFYAVGLQIVGLASLISSINLVVTVINMRAPGMTWWRLPVFTWMSLVTQFLLVFAVPVISVALFLLTFDRLFGATFFNAGAGGDPFLWQHLFWIFGHPEVYIILMPVFGMISDIIPVFSRKPLFGYRFVVFSGIAIGFLGFGVWAHHMFASGIGPMSVTAFSLATMFIAVPTGVKVLNWLATMWGGRIRLDLPMLYAIAFVAMFTIGGLSGVTHAFASADTQQTDTYYIVAHFHYVIFGGGVLGLLGGTYFWFPKIFGFKLSEGLGKAAFWVVLVGFNLTFGPMHVLGMEGMSRRIFTYSDYQGFNLWNLVATLGSYVLAVGVAMFLANVFLSYRSHKANPVDVGPDPWDARTLEWTIQSPPPEYNFDPIPVVHEVDEAWHLKYGHDEDGRAVRIAEMEDLAQPGDSVGVHLPSPSYMPILLASGLPFIGYGVIFNLWFAVLGGLLVIAGFVGWSFEPSDDPDVPHDEHHDGHDPVDGSDGAATNGHSGDGAEPTAEASPAGPSGETSQETADV